MSRNITNCIQKILTESGNMVIFSLNIRTHFRYICYLDIFRFLYIIIELNSKTTQKFIIFKRCLI